MMLTQRGDAIAEVEQMLADDPESVFGHCLRAALIVRADSAAARSTLAASIAAIEAACPDNDAAARRHAVAARAWLDGDPAGAAALYGAILVARPHDVLALAAAHALDFHLGRRRMMLDRIAKVVPCLRCMPSPSKKMGSFAAPKRWRGARWLSIPGILAPSMSLPM